jgi:hypothetical protein
MVLGLSGIRKKPIPDPGSRGQKAPDPGSRIRIRNTAFSKLVLWSRIGFNADAVPDRTFYLNADPDLGKTLRILSSEVDLTKSNFIR